MNNETTVTKQKGRPVVANSNRQAKLAERAARIAAGGSISRGRPSNPSSARQVRLATQAEKIASGLTIKPGRPKMVKTESATAELI